MSNRKKSSSVPKDMAFGTTHKNVAGYEFTVIDYIDKANVTVVFTGYAHHVKTRSISIRNGKVKNVMMPSVLGKGYFGIGDYSSTKHKKSSQK